MTCQPHRSVAPALLVVVGALAGLIVTGGQARGSERAGLISHAAAPALFTAHAARSDRPRVLLFSATPATVPASGGAVKLRALVENATSCRFAAAQKLRSLPKSIGCAHGRASLTVDFAANHGGSQRTYSFSLEVSGKHGKLKAPTVAVRESAERPSGTSSLSSNRTPQVTTQPASETVAAGATASFTAAASGTPTPNVEWLVSTDGGGTWNLVLGASSPTYSFTATAADSGEEFEAVFWNNVSAATSSPATLTIGIPPQVTTQPSSVTIAAGNSASITAAAAGTPAPSVQWQVSTDGGNSWGTLAGATSTTYSFTTSWQESGYQYRAVFTNAVGSVSSAAATLTLTDQTSSNWSGYVATGGTFSAVTASWTVPAVTCNSPSASYSADWVGIDGESSTTVEQDGTESDCLGGSASYDAWYELYGDNAFHSGNEVELSKSAYPVKPGDSITAAVSGIGGAWTLTISNATESWASVTRVSWSTPAQSSAEWVAERPTIGMSLPSLANFGTVAFTGAGATDAGASGPISDFTFAPIEMLASPSDMLASPSQLDPTGADFTDTWNSSS